MNLKYIKLILLFILIPFLSSAQNNYTSHNSIRIESIYKSGVRSIDSIDFLNHTEKAVGVEYRDGLGRNFYQSAVAASPFKRDISSFSVYNGSQGIDTAYLSFISRTLDGELLSKQNAIEELLSFYAETKNKVVDDAYPFAVMKYDNSPNQRVIEAGKPGYDWQLGQHTRKFKTYTNLANQYKIWKADLTSSAFYVAGTLLIKENLDEDNNITRAIYNNEGQIIEKHQQVDGIIFAKTIYIYNRIGLLKCIIQPEGVNRIGSANTIAQNIIDNFSTHYKYDNKGRLVEKYIAGGGSTFYVYDKADRLVLYQDENSKAKNKWIFTKVDVHGRILMKGFYNSTSTRDALQNQLDSFYSNSSILPYEERLKQGSEVYTNQSFPNQNTELLALYFYDNDYDTNNNQVSDIISSDIELPFRNLIQRNFGTLSASKVKVLGTNNWLTQYNYYDQYGRIIVTKFNTHVQINHFNTVYFEYDNFGNLKSTKKIHKNIDGTLTTLALSYEYDHAKRPINIWHKINDQTEVNVVNFVYNEIGQLVKKNIHFDSSLGNPTSNPEQLHSVDISKSVYATSEKKLIARNEIKLLPGYSANASIGQTLTATIDIESAENALAASYVQSIDYNYTIHGELAGVNRVKDAQDLFAAELFYNNSNENLPITPKWNGAISGIKSSSTGSSHTAEFSAYQYDNANRLKNISYVGKAETGLWNKNTNVFNEKFSYDLNGNITNLIRNTTAYDEASPVPNYKAAHLDSLIFTYNFGNQLKKVNDRSSNQAGFKNTGSSTDDFAYNSAGAITQDKNKGIDSVKYNAFGLIERVKFSSGKSIQYYYDANGSKLSMKMVDGNQTQHTKYVGEFIYRNDTLEFISSPEGRLVQKSNAFKYEYFITDHMGNNRVLFKSDAATENTYTANFETSTNNEFTNYNNRVGFNLMDKTDAGTTYTYSQKLTGGFNAQVGLSKSLKVYPGDKIEIQAFAKYLSSSQTTNLAGFASALTQAFGLSATSTGEAAKAFQSINEYGGFIATGNGEGNSNHPKAFINILVYDKDFNFLDLAFDQVQGGEQIPNGANTPHDELNINYEVKKEGYIFFFLSYEDTRSFEVYFDDVNIKHKETRIIQYNEYYAHGMLNANSWIRTANSNKNLFNAGTELNATTNWYDTPMRGLDPVLGRFMQLDALAELSPSLTPYRFGFNNPMSFNDPTGAYENNYGLIGDVGNYVGRGHDKEGDAGLARYFGNYNEERMIRNEAMNVGGGGTTMSVSEFLVEMWTGKNKGGSWKNGKGKIYDNVKDAKNNFRDNLGINVWAAERKKRKLIILIDEILFGEKLQEFDKKLKAQKRVEAALMVIENYRANGTKYSQEKRQFGCDVDYADCSSTFTTIIGQAGQENIFKGKRTADMRDEIASKPTNNKYRFNDPLPGDVMMWGKHVAMVTDVIDGKVYFATMGLSGASIAKVKLDESCSLLTENKWGGGGFLGFWTPD